MQEPARLRIDPNPAAVAQARAFVGDHVCPEHTPDAVNAAVLLVSELVTNAVVHGGPPIVLEVSCDSESRLRVRVHDAAQELPRAGELVGVDREGGRGIALVDLLSEDWGVDSHESDGKTVWFVLSLDRDPLTA